MDPVKKQIPLLKGRLLILSYYWPPSGGAGVQRWVKMANNLVEQGYEITVITPENPSAPYFDDSLEKELDSRIKSIKTKTVEPYSLFNFLRGKKGKSVGVGTTGLKGKEPIKKIGLYLRSNFFIPDARMGWNLYLMNAAKKELKENQVDLIISTGPPHSTHLAALNLKKKFNVPWLADFRDPWTSIFYLKEFPLTKNSWAKHLKLEREVLSKASCVTTVSEHMAEEFKKKSGKVEVVYNGFDQRDFDSKSPSDVPTKVQRTLAYIGNFKPNQVFDGFADCFRKVLENFDDLKIKFVGTSDPKLREEMDKIGFQERIEFVGPVSHSNAIKELNSSDALLFIIPRGENEEGIITGKIYEYLASKKPILAIGPKNGEASRILNKLKSPFPMIEYYNPEEILSSLQSIFKHIDESPERSVVYEDLEFFSRQNQAKRMDQIIQNLIS